MVKKIALSGMKGRKKDTFVMLLAVVLSVVFIVTSINLFTSAQAAKQIEKFERFGHWQSAFFNVDEETAKQLEAEYKDAASMTLLGHDQHVGQIASIPSDHKTIGEFKMFSGNMPTSDDEIAIEYGQLQNFTDTLSVGDTIRVEQVYFVKEYEVPTELDPRIQVFLRERLGRRDALSGQYERLARGGYIDYLNSFSDPYHPTHSFNVNLFDSEEAATFEEFYDLFVERSAEQWQFYYPPDEEALAGAEYIPPLFFFGSNEYNTIDTEFIEEYRLDRIQKIIYYRRIDTMTSLGWSATFLEDSPEDSEKTLVELIQEFGKPYSDYVVITREYTISGVFEDYSGIWESGSYVLPSAFVTEDEKDKLIGYLKTTSLVSSSEALIKPESQVSKRIVFLSDGLNKSTFETENLVLNTLSYPEVEAKADLTLTYGILALIFVGTAISIFQINYAQMKRRTKKLVLLKSIGMVNGQLIGLLLWEVFLVLILAIPIGLILGTTISFGLVFMIQRFSEFRIVFDVNESWLLLGVLASVLSVLLGMLIPMKVAKSVPLTGAMNTPQKRSTKVHKHHDVSDKMKRLTFGRMMIRSYSNEKKKTLITFGLYGIASLMVSFTVILSFFAFKSYVNDVIIPNRPDYFLSFNVGLNEFAIDDAIEAINESGMFEEPEMVLVGEQLRLYHPDLMSIERYVKRNINDNLYGDMNFLDGLFGSDERVTYSERSIKTKLYSYSQTSETLEELYRLAGVDPIQYPFDAFITSKNQVILVLPYHDGIETTSYDYRDRFNLDASYPFKVGDTLKVASLFEESEAVEEIQEELEIIGLVHGFEKIGIWPLTMTLDEPVIVSGRAPFRKMYPITQYRRIVSKEYLDGYVVMRNWMKFGKSYMVLNLKPGVDQISANYALDKATYIPFNLYGTLHPSAFEYVSIDPSYLVKQSAFEKSLRMAVIFTTLGLSMAMIMLMAQYNIGVSKLENERDKIGVLQALGVTRGSFKRGYAVSGVVFSLVTAAATNILFFSGILVFSILSQSDFSSAISEILWRFPWRIYGLSQLVFLGVGTLVYYLPCLKIIKNQPIVNINAR